MSHDLPPLKSLQVFDACMRLGSFTRAARALNVGQPAVSHQINALERDLGVSLFDRRGAQTLPTAAAQTYHRSIAAALAEMTRATIALRASTREPGLTLATYPGIAMFWLMPKLAPLRAADPALRLRVTTAERDRDIRMEDVDCAILFGDGDWPGYESHLLMREAVIPVAAPAIAERLSDPSAGGFLAQGPLIHLEDSDRRWFTWQDWRDQRAPDCAQIDRGVQVTNHGIAIHQTLMGQGISLGWLGVIDDLIQSGLLVALANAPLCSDRGYYLVATGAFLQSRIGARMIEALVPADDGAGGAARLR